MKIIKRSDIPDDIVKILGNTNGTIVYNLVTDIIQNSFQKSYVAFSSEISDALKKLKDFNLEYIYMNSKIKTNLNRIKELFEMLFERYLNDVENKNYSSVVFMGFLEDMSCDYIENHSKEEMVRDFIAGMTDKYFLRQCPVEMRPKIQIK